MYPIIVNIDNNLITIWLVFSTRSVFSYLCPRVTVTFSWVADYILTFVAIFHKYISFFQLGSIFKQRRRSLINSLFSLSQITLVDRKILVSKWIFINNGLQLILIVHKKHPESYNVRYLVTVELIELSFIKHLNFLKQFFRSERASKVVISVLQQIYALGESFQVRSIWTFEP